MNNTAPRIAAILFELRWQSQFAAHRELFYAREVDYTRDTLPVGLKGKITALGPGDSVTRKMDPSDIPAFQQGFILELPRSRFLAPVVDGKALTPRVGRFYPRRMLDKVPGAGPNSPVPFRVVDGSKSSFTADLNHPMAGREVEMKATVLDVRLRAGLPRTDPVDWPSTLLDGPGMQARLKSSATDFLGNEPFARPDESDDGEYYTTPRPEILLDASALETVRELNGAGLAPGADVLDLMAAGDSHLPEGYAPGSLVGLGLDQHGMNANPALTRRVVRNLNMQPTLPFPDESFDAVRCSLSVEYLTRPFEVFAEAARVLRPGGTLVVTFSNRWDEGKVVRIWPRIFEFERMGLAAQYFMKSGRFADLATVSDRGRLRSAEQAAAHPNLPHSDPVYAVMARRA